MAVKLSSTKVDLERERNGDWVDYEEWGVRFHVRSLNYPAYVTARDLLVQRLQTEYKSNKIPDEVFIPKLGELYAIHILTNWEGFDEAYSAPLALQHLSDPTGREMVKAVERCAHKISQISPVFVEGEIKNSKKPSADA